MLNFYSVLPKHLVNKYNNPGFQQHGIEHPFRMLIVGGSGAGKTNFVLNLLRVMAGTFDHVTICTRNADEPLYNYLRTKIHDSQLDIVEGIENIPPLESLDSDSQHLVVFDDLVLAKNQSAIEEYFIRARKIARGVSVCYLTQSYFRTPKTIRINCSYIVLKQLSSTRDLSLVLSDYGLGVDKKHLERVYAYATRVKEDALIIDTQRRLFRKNFTELL